MRFPSDSVESECQSFAGLKARGRMIDKAGEEHEVTWDRCEPGQWRYIESDILWRTPQFKRAFVHLHFRRDRYMRR